MTHRPNESRSLVPKLRTSLDRERLAIDIALEPLGQTDVESMVIATLEGRHIDVSPDLLERIVRLAEGNPFFVEEILRTLLADGARPTAACGFPAQSTTPSSNASKDWLRQRAARRPWPRSIGREFDLGLLQRLLNWDEEQVLHAMADLVGAELVVERAEEARFTFRHELTRQAIYSDLLGHERRRLHAQLVSWIEQELERGDTSARVEDLADQAFAAQDWQRTLIYAARASERALALLAPRAAIEHAERAMQAATRLNAPTPVEVYSQRGRAHEILGEFEAARADYDMALEQADRDADPQQQSTCLMDLALLWSGRDYTRAGAYATRAVEAARRTDDPVLLARGLNRVGNWHMNTGRVKEAIDCHEQALAILEPTAPARELSETLDLLGMSTNLVDPVLSAAYYARVLPLLRRADDRRGLATDLVTHAIQGGFFANDTFATAVLDDAQSERDLEEALQLTRAIPWPAGESFALWESAAWLGFRGRFAEALQKAEASLRVAEQIEHRQWTIGALWSLGGLFVSLLVARTRYAPAGARPRAVGGAGVRDVDSAGRKHARPGAPATRTPRRCACGARACAWARESGRGHVDASGLGSAGRTGARPA